LITTQWFTAFRISETAALTVGHVWRNGSVVQDIALAPRHLKGGRGRTRRVPVSPELRRALIRHLWWLRLKYTLSPHLPLFPSRQTGPDGTVRPITRVQAYLIIKAAFAKAGIEDDGRLATHVFRKTVARATYARCKDPLLIRDLLGHVDVGTTQRYLETSADAVREALLGCDFTRRPRKKKPALTVVPVPVGDNVLPFAQAAVAINPMPAEAQASCSVY
jgi:integrase